MIDVDTVNVKTINRNRNGKQKLVVIKVKVKIINKDSKTTGVLFIRHIPSFTPDIYPFSSFDI